MGTRGDVADFLSALLQVYVIVLVAYIVVQFVLSIGRLPTYNRVIGAVLRFLEDTAEPYLRLFRPLPLRVGPFDFTPIVAIIVLEVVGSLIIGIVRG